MNKNIAKITIFADFLLERNWEKEPMIEIP
jgi:hypothetical protein